MPESSSKNKAAGSHAPGTFTHVASSAIAGTYHSLYSCIEGKSAIEQIEELPGEEPGVRIRLCSGMEGFSHFICSTESLAYPDFGSKKNSAAFGAHTGGEDFKALEKSEIVAKFDDLICSGDVQDKIFRLKPVFHDGSAGDSFTVIVRGEPARFREKYGRTYLNTIYVFSRPVLDISPGSFADWPVDRPSRAEKSFASRRWGCLINGVEGTYEKAKTLAAALIKGLLPREGIPSDEMNGLTAFQQYERMVSGKDRGYCSQRMYVFTMACNALGIPARRCGLNEILYHSGNSRKCSRLDLRIQHGNSHDTSEIFDAGLGQWVWMDLGISSMGAWLGDTGPLTLAEFQLFMNQENRRKQLKMLVYDMESGSEELLPLEDCPRYPASFTSYAGSGTKLYYRKPVG